MNSEKRWWVSWWHSHSELGEFELHLPWWFSGESEEGRSVCAAIIAGSEHEARAAVFVCYDKPPKEIDFRFVDERPEDWSPWDLPNGGTSRFQKAKWMQWPETKKD